MREIFASGGPVQASAVVEDGNLVEFFEDECDALADTVILGKVSRVVPGLQAAFVDIGEEKNGFLPLAEKKLTDGARYTGLEEKLQAGDRVLVQVRREAMGSKGAFLSRDLSLAGSFSILMPCNTMVGVSSRITSDNRREALKTLGASITGGSMGIVLRTSAEDAEDESIRTEAEGLIEQWESIRRAAATAHAPSVIYRKPGSVDQLITDYLPKGIAAVYTNDRRVYEQYQHTLPVTYSSDDPITSRGLDHQCRRALERKVWLKSGGNLVIDECEALTVIDVNSAKNTGTRKDRRVLMRTNLEACQEIARQIRLRNLGGIIIIDMIDMETDDERSLVLEALQAELLNDRVKTVVHGFTELGLIEMTRRRTHRKVRDYFEQTCPKCRGTGYVPKAQATGECSSDPMQAVQLSDPEEGVAICRNAADS